MDPIHEGSKAVWNGVEAIAKTNADHIKMMATQLKRSYDASVYQSDVVVTRAHKEGGPKRTSLF